MRILIIRYSALGDVVLATSLVEPLRAKYPGAVISWVVDQGHAKLLEGTVDELIPFSRKDSASRAAVLQNVRGRFDLAIDLQNKIWSRRVAWNAADQRKTFMRRTPMQALSSLFGRDVVLDSTHATVLYAQAAGLERAGRVTLHAGEYELPEGRWIGLGPGAAWETKRWSAERFGELAKRFVKRGFKVALFGGPMDGALLETVKASGAVSLDLSAERLETLSAALKKMTLFVGNDSGLAHIATAVGTPALALFGPTSVTRWGPTAPGRAFSLKLACSPCTNHGSHVCPLGHHDCLKLMTVEQVEAVAEEIVGTPLPDPLPKGEGIPR